MLLTLAKYSNCEEHLHVQRSGHIFYFAGIENEFTGMSFFLYKTLSEFPQTVAYIILPTGHSEVTMGEYGTPGRNERGERLLDFLS